MKKILLTCLVMCFAGLILADSILVLYTQTTVANKIQEADFPQAVATIISSAQFNWTADHTGVTITAYVPQTTPVANAIRAKATAVYPKIKVLSFSVRPTATMTATVTP